MKHDNIRSHVVVLDEFSLLISRVLGDDVVAGGIHTNREAFKQVGRVVVIIDRGPWIERSEKQMEECCGQARMQPIQQGLSSDFVTPSSDRAFISRMPGRAPSRLCGSPRR